MSKDPALLRHLREFLNLTQANAAQLAGVSERVWRSYETDLRKCSSRTIGEHTLRHFCRQAGLRYPPFDGNGGIRRYAGWVISLTALKGGVGKTPLTEEIANLLAEEGYKVAIISNDDIYRYAEELKRQIPYTPSSLTRVREIDVLMSADELSKLESKMGAEPWKAKVCGREITFDSIKNDYVERLNRKRNRKFTLEEIKASHDYVFLDLNRMPEVTCVHSDMVVLLLNAQCPYSPHAEKRFLEIAEENLNGVRPTNVYGLVINKAVQSTRDAYQIDNEDALQQFYEQFKYVNLWQQEVDDLNIPILHSSLSGAIELEYEIANAELSFRERGYLGRPLARLSPRSMAASELRGLRDEIVTCLSLLECGPRIVPNRDRHTPQLEQKSGMPSIDR